MANNTFFQTDPSIRRKQALANVMANRGMEQGPVQHWTQGLNRMLSAGLGAYYGKQAQQEGQADIAGKRDALVNALAGAGASDTTQKITKMNPALGVQMFSANQAAKRKAASEQADKDSEPPFAGTGMDAQMLNIFLDESIPDDDPRKILARQRLQQQKTVTTPTGTYVMPGYDLAATAPPQQDQQAGAASTEFVQKPATEAQAKASGFYDRMIEAQKNIDELGDFNPISAEETVKGFTNVTASPEKQRYNQAANDWIRAKLRKESGAVIGEEEMASEYRTYFPIFGDSPEVIEQKAKARKVAEEAMRKSGPVGLESKATPTPSTQADYDALPSGAVYIDPDDGKKYRKP